MPSAPAFRIVVYQTTAPAETPETAQFVAGLLIGYDAQARWVLSGSTAEAARTKMEEFWAKERKSYEPRQAPKKGQPSAGMDVEPEPEAAPVSVADDNEVL